MNHHGLDVTGQGAPPCAQFSTLTPLLLSLLLACSSDLPPTPAVAGAVAGAGGYGGAAVSGYSGAGGQPATAAGGTAGASGSLAGAGSRAGASSAGVSTGGTGGDLEGSGGAADVQAEAGAGGSDQAPNKPIKVWMAGDSTMQECSAGCPCGWGSRFDKLFDSDVTVVNRAVGGRSIQTWLYEGAVSPNKDASGECALSSSSYASRWNEMLDAATGMREGDYLFVQFGINDSTSECPRHVGLEKFKSYLVSMANAALARGAIPVLVTPVSAISCTGATAVGTRGAFVAATKAASMTCGAPLIDLHQLSIDRYTALGLCPNDGRYGAGKVGAFFCQDHTHFEAAGAEEVAKLVARATADAELSLARYSLLAP